MQIESPELLYFHRSCWEKPKSDSCLVDRRWAEGILKHKKHKAILLRPCRQQLDSISQNYKYAYSLTQQSHFWELVLYVKHDKCTKLFTGGPAGDSTTLTTTQAFFNEGLVG